jgi:hypothetical protein
MPDANYCVVTATEFASTSARVFSRSPSGTYTTTAVQLENAEYRSIAADGPWLNVAVFR